MSHGENGTWSYGDDFKIQRAKGAFDDLEKSWKEKADRVETGEIIPASNEQNRIQFFAHGVPPSGYRNYLLVNEKPSGVEKVLALNKTT